MKLSTCLRQTEKATENLKLNTNRLEIEAKEKNCTTLDVEEIIFFFCLFHIYTQILIFIAALVIQLSFKLILKKYVEHLILL